MIAMPAVPPAVAYLAPDTTDHSPHHQRFIAVNGARLEVLDWGGHGPMLVFLPGFGDGAHIFDDIAPRFTDRFHVVAVTPRGCPPSSAPDSGYSIRQVSEDVAGVLDSLGATRAILVGHSISGAVMTQFAEAHADRLAAAIYLDAAFDFGPVSKRPRMVGITAAVDTTAPRVRAWRRRYEQEPPALQTDLQMWPRLDSVDRARRQRLFTALATEVRGRPHEVWRVKAPALAVCPIASFDREFGWLTPDSTRWAAAHRYIADKDSSQRAVCTDFQERLPHGHSFDIEGSHYVFLDHPREVVRAMRQFLSGIAWPRE